MFEILLQIICLIGGSFLFLFACFGIILLIVAIAWTTKKFVESMEYISEHGIIGSLNNLVKPK